MEIPNFGDLVTNRSLEGDKLKIEGIIGKTIIVTGFRISKSKYTNKGTDYCTTIQFYFEDDESQKKYVIFTGSSVIRDQIEEIGQKLDEADMDHVFRTSIQKIGNYHSLT